MAEQTATAQQTGPSTYEQYYRAREGKPTQPAAEASVVKEPEISTQNEPPAEEAHEEESAKTAPASATGGEKDVDEKQEQTKKPGGGFQRRINEMTREKHELTARIKELETQQQERIAELERRLEQVGKSKPAEEPEQEAQEPVINPAPQADARPKMADFDSIEEYEDARDAWRDRQRQAAENERIAKQQQEQTLVEFGKRLEEAGKRFQDFEQVVSAAKDVEITPQMTVVIENDPTGPDMLYHLAKNPDEARRIAALNPVQQLFELGAIAASLRPKSTPAPAPATSEPKSTNSTPPPPQPARVLGGSASRMATTETAKTFEEFMQARGGARK